MTPLRTLLLRVLALSAAAPILHCGANVTPGLDAAVADAGLCDASLIDGGSFCGGRTYSFPCGLPPGIRVGVLVANECPAFCLTGPSPAYVCEARAATPERPAEVECNSPCPIDGRRPAGFSLPPADADVDPTRAFLARSAALECAAVTAFEHLAAELSAHGAPAGLRARALASADDERRHTRVMAALARRRGLDVTPVAPALPAVRPLIDVAIENAVEGCVRETYGALVAWWQAERAGDPDVAAACRAIAEDETRHAELAADVAAWIEPRLDGAQRAAVRAARARAIDELRAEMAEAVPRSLIAAAGVPSALEAARLIAGLDDGLWSAAA
ncbi:MAG: ferritin-like domain-containing protein [Myxococcales bacterium]|nr:ferritin-like domain-containing protein [Myxococcales bacterium]